MDPRLIGYAREAVPRLLGTSGCAPLTFHRFCFARPIVCDKMLGPIVRWLGGVVVDIVVVPSNDILYVVARTDMIYYFIYCVLVFLFLVDVHSAVSVFVLPYEVLELLMMLWRPGRFEASPVFDFAMCGACVVRSIKTLFCTLYVSITRK